MKTLALIAHDGKKAAMLDWARTHREFLSHHSIVATGTTGGLLESQIGLTVRKMLSGPLGGDLQIGALIVTEQIAAVIFLRDPLTPHPHEPDISALMKACDIHNVPLATNVASANLLLTGLQALRSD
ncbi:methylglyoxal synthase [Abditibacteriota bacterium]|nr:methylglyoxal synthase [Abditibacteriota bacterium]